MGRALVGAVASELDCAGADSGGSARLAVVQRQREAVRAGLAEDAEDLEAFRGRAKEPTSSFENLVSDLKRRGEL